MVKQLTGTAVQEYTRLMNNQGYSSASPVNSAAIFNPIGSAIIALGGTEQDYNDFSFLTGLLLGATSQHYSIYKPYYEAYAASRMYGNQVNNEPVIGNKLNYVFGEATGRKHNLERTNEMTLTLKGIGINNDTLGRKVVYDNLVNTFHNPNSVTNRESYYNPYDGITYNKTEREAFLMGPAGGVKIGSIWWDNELKTVKIYGHKNKAGE